MCKGTVNMQDVHLVKIKNIPSESLSKFANPKWIELHGGIPVDRCIGPEVESLILRGIVTVGSCCGHGVGMPSILIDKDSVDLASEIGYDVRALSDTHSNRGIFEIVPKTTGIKDGREGG